MTKLIKTSLVSILLMLGFQASAMELAVNGDLETGDLTGWEVFATAPPSAATVSSVNPSSGSFSLNIVNEQTESSFVVKQANVGVGVVTPGQQVNISFDARGSFDIGGVLFAEVFSELAGGGTSFGEILGGAPLALDADPEVWTTFNFTTTLGPDVSGGMTLQFAAVTGAGNLANVFIDNVSISPVPVPAAVWLLLSGLGFLGVCRKRA